MYITLTVNGSYISQPSIVYNGGFCDSDHAHTQNHLGLSTNLALNSQQHNRRDLKFKIYCMHINFVNSFNWISYSDLNHTCINSQYSLHITSTDHMILSLAMAVPKKQMCDTGLSTAITT